MLSFLLHEFAKPWFVCIAVLNVTILWCLFRDVGCCSDLGDSFSSHPFLVLGTTFTEYHFWMCLIVLLIKANVCIYICLLHLPFNSFCSCLDRHDRDDFNNDIFFPWRNNALCPCSCWTEFGTFQCRKHSHLLWLANSLPFPSQASRFALHRLLFFTDFATPCCFLQDMRFYF